jgi:hypothetical protein
VTEKTPEEDYYKSSGLRPKGVNPLLILMVLSAGAVLAVLAVASQFAARPDCLNTKLSEALAPDGNHRAVVFARTCRRGDPVEGHVSVLLAGESFGDAPATAAIVSPILATETEGRWATKDIAVAWDGSSILTISYRDGLALVFDAHQAGKVLVRTAAAKLEPPAPP